MPNNDLIEYKEKGIWDKIKERVDKLLGIERELKIVTNADIKDGKYVIPKRIRSIGKGAFDCCSSLTSVNISKEVRSIGNKAFQNCKNLDTDSIRKIKEIQKTDQNLQLDSQDDDDRGDL